MCSPSSPWQAVRIWRDEGAILGVAGSNSDRACRRSRKRPMSACAAIAEARSPVPTSGARPRRGRSKPTSKWFTIQLIAAHDDDEAENESEMRGSPPALPKGPAARDGQRRTSWSHRGLHAGGSTGHVVDWSRMRFEDKQELGNRIAVGEEHQYQQDRVPQRRSHSARGGTRAGGLTTSAYCSGTMTVLSPMRANEHDDEQNC